mgnify:CR=1 FL=1
MKLTSIKPLYISLSNNDPISQGVGVTATASLEGRPVSVVQRHGGAQVHAHVEGLRGVED